MCQVDRAVKVELLLARLLQAPSFQQYTVSLPYRGHNLLTVDNLCLLKSKLKSFYGRGAEKDYTDIKHLIRADGAFIRSQKHRLDEDAVQFFIETGMQGMFREEPQAIQQAKSILVFP